MTKLIRSTFAMFLIALSIGSAQPKGSKIDLLTGAASRSWRATRMEVGGTTKRSVITATFYRNGRYRSVEKGVTTTGRWRLSDNEDQLIVSDRTVHGVRDTDDLPMEIVVLDRHSLGLAYTKDGKPTRVAFTRVIPKRRK